MPELKIVHTESHTQWGGQERRVLYESLWMRDQGHRLILLAPAGTPINDKARTAGLEVYDIPFKTATMAADYFRVKKRLREIQPDVFNTHGNTDTKVGLTAAHGLGIPCIIRSRHSAPAVANSWYNQLLYNKRCHAIMTIAHCITQQLIRDLGVAENRIFTIPSGIAPPAALLDRHTARQNIIDRYGLPSAAAFIGFVGRFSPEKGIDCLVEAFAQLASKLDRHYLILVGDGGERAVLAAQAQRLGIAHRVLFTGYQDDPWPYFCAFDCFILASAQYEGPSQVILQAMYAQCPVIGTNIGGIPDVITHLQTGLLVPPNHPAQLAEAILDTITNHELTPHRIQQARQFVCDNHTLDAMGQKILAIYRKMGLTSHKDEPNKKSLIE